MVVDLATPIYISLGEEFHQLQLRKEESHVLGELTELTQVDRATPISVKLSEQISN